MAKTVLQYVTACLESMDSDAVTAISDTAESQQVANFLQDVYFEFVNRDEWPWLESAITLTAAATVSLPTKFTIPVTVKEVLRFSYNDDKTGSSPHYKPLTYCEPGDFIDRYGQLAKASNNQLVTIETGLKLYVYNDRMPTYWTSFNDRDIFLDSFDSAIESTVAISKASTWGVVIPTFTVSGSFTPQLPEHLVPLLQSLLNERAHLKLKQQDSPVDTAVANRQTSQSRRRPSVTQGQKDYHANRYGKR